MKSKLIPNAVGVGNKEAGYYFLHIPKTAGTTLITFLDSIFNDFEICSARDWHVLLKTRPELHRRNRLFRGHFYAYLYKYVEMPLRYITFLREPIERALSHYGHVIRDETHYLHRRAHELGSFGAYLRDPEMRMTVSNFQVRALANDLDPLRIALNLTQEQLDAYVLEQRLETSPSRMPDNELLHIARTRLDQMCFVGITEQFSKSIELLCETFEWPNPVDLRPHNINPQRIQRPAISQRDLDELIQMNQADIALYQYAHDVFLTRFKKMKAVRPSLGALVSYSQNNEDIMLYRALKDIENGFYVDVGANDPTGDSVTKIFYDRGWRGINIEPMMQVCERLSAERPRDVCINAAVMSSRGRIPLYEIAGTGLSTLDSEIAKQHMEGGYDVTLVDVPALTLNEILADYDVNAIHFLKIDVEGMEHEVLMSIDLDRHRPWIVVVEATRPNTNEIAYHKWEHILKKSGYEFVYFDGLNRFYLACEKITLKPFFDVPPNVFDNFLRASEINNLQSLRKMTLEVQRGSARWARSIEYTKSLAAELERQNTKFMNDRERWHREQILITTDRDALRTWGEKSEAYAKSLSSELEKERVRSKTECDALRTWGEKSEAYAKSLSSELEKERVRSKTECDALRTWGEKSEAYAKSLAVNLEKIIQGTESERENWQNKQQAMNKDIASLTEQLIKLQSHWLYSFYRLFK